MAFAMQELWEKLPEPMVYHLGVSKSDHMPILLCFTRPIHPERSRGKRLGFEDYWLHEEDCQHMVQEAWNNAEGGCLVKIQCCSC